MPPEQLLERLKAQSESSSGVTLGTLDELKKYFDELKTNLMAGSARPQDIFGFKERVIGLILASLQKHNHTPKEKVKLLELLERDLVSSRHNVNFFNRLYNYLVEEDENVGIQACKTMDALIKQINEGSQASANPTQLDTRQHYLKLFEFLKERTEFLLRLHDHVRDPEFRCFKRTALDERERDREREREREKERKEVVFKNTKSLKFINQVPHLFIHLMAYVDTGSRSADEDNKIRDLIRKSIDNIVQALKKTPYEEFYNEYNWEFNNELFGVMTKLLQFLFINLRSDKDQSGNKNNINLKKHIADQIEHIKVPEVIKNFIYLLKNCSEDFQLNRYEIVNRLKLLMNNLDRGKLGRVDAIEIMGEILNQETIFGRKRIIGDYSKNAICSFWIEMIRSPVLIHNIFPQNILSLRSAAQQGHLTEESPEIHHCFSNIQRLVQQVLKTIFDNTFYPSVQEKCIELITYLIDQLFPDGLDNIDASALNSGSAVIKRIQEHKLRILLRILDCASLKLQSIRHIFEEIDHYVVSKMGHRPSKKELPEPLKLEHMQLNSLSPSMIDSPRWGEEAVSFVENSGEEIDASLLTLSVVQNKFITIYEEEDELCFNSHPVKLNNFPLYLKEVKTKLLEKCITLSHKITKTFLSQNIDIYTPFDMGSLKQIYFILSNKRALTPEQCKVLSAILRNGLRIFEILHLYDLHSDEQTNKKGHLKNFMLIFAQIYDPVNFRDIFEPNMNEFFHNLINYAKNCADYCLQFVLIEPYCSNSNQQQQPFNKNIVELLTYNLILRLESTSDQLDPFHDFYAYRQEYFLLLQKLIRFPFRCLSRYSDESFIRNYFRQIILFLTKKAHTSRFCLDYLHLMRTLFKNILFNSNRQAASPLFSEFYAICCKNPASQQQPSTPHSLFINVNILDNFLRFYETGIPELADIVTELVIMLPLKSKHIIQFAKQGYIVKPLLHCLCLMSDYNYLLRTLKTFQIIISHSTAQQIAQFLDGLKEKLINRLFEMVLHEYKATDLKPEKINNDLSSLSLKLLAKLGALSRNRNPSVAVKPKTSPDLSDEFRLVLEGMERKAEAPIGMTIDYAIEVFHKLLDSFYQSIIFVSMELIEKSFELLMAVLPVALQKMNPLAEKILSVFSAILALSSKYLTISPTILSRIREQVKAEIKSFAEAVKEEVIAKGLTPYARFFLKALISNLSERVLITREQNFVKEISQQPKKFLWGLVLNLMEETKADKAIYNQLVELVMKMLISGSLQLSNPHQIRLNAYQEDYNHILPFKNAALAALSEMIDRAPHQVLEEVYPDALETAFVAASTIPDILSLKIMKHPRAIVKKVYKFMLRDEQAFLANFKSIKVERVFGYILDHLVGYSVEAHNMALEFINMIMRETSLNITELLYGGEKWEDLCDGNGLGKTQAKYSLSDFSSWKEKGRKTYPIVPLVRNLLRVAHNINEESLKSSSNQLKMLHNCFATFELLISLRHKGKTYQAFQMLTVPKEDNDQSISFNDTFKKIITVAQQTITINEKIYENFTKIIIEQPPAANAPAPAPGAAGGVAPRPGAPPQPQPGLRPREGAAPGAAPAGNQAFNINTNTFIDDEEYGLNIQDLDMEVKSWGRLISAILRFLKSILLNENIFTASKSMQRRSRNERTKLVQTRLQIIFSMFELIGRVDKQVRDTAYECLRELLSREEHPKDLIQNDEKLKHILRPVLISLQLQFKKFTPSFLVMFRKILKLLTQCFNITLIQKLVDKLREMQKSKESESNSVSKQLPTTQQTTKYLNYSEITLETKCIANFLGLFQHLAYAYHNHRSANYTLNSLTLIFKYVSNICNYFTNKLGRFAIRTHIKTTLARVLNTMCEKLTGEAIFEQGQERELDLENFLEVISLDDSFPLREKMTRETTYLDKTFAELSKSPKSKKDFLVFLEIVLVLARRNSRWLKGFASFGERLVRELDSSIHNRLMNREQKKELELNERNQVVILARILLEYIKQNQEDLKALFALVGVFKLRGTYDFHFVKTYLKYDLYESTTGQVKRQIMMDFLGMVRSQGNDSERVIAVSQHIVYHFVLAEVNMEPAQRQVLTNHEEMLKMLTDSIKYCLNPRNFHNRGLSQANFRQSANNYRIAIQILQLSNLALGALKEILGESHRNSILLTVWGLLRMEDKIIKNYAFVWTSNYIRTFENFEATKSLGLYLTLIRGLESLTHGDYEIGALIKKALNIMIPYWDGKGAPQGQASWIDWSLKAVHEDNNEPNKLVRFWEIVVKNHKIFHKYKESKFETQMVNSMQWLMVANNPTSSNPLVKKIASDMSFIYIEWKYKEAKGKLDKTPAEVKVAALEDSSNDRAAQICLNFFIKVALNNSNDKDDKEIMKRSLYLLKKTLILWPNTRKKFDAIKTVVNKLKSSNMSSVQSAEMPLRFHFTLLNIIHILLQYEPDIKLLPQLTGIFKLLELGAQFTPPRFSGTPHAQTGTTIFTMSNIYLLDLLCSIVKRLVRVAAAHEKEEESRNLMQEIHQYIRDGFEHFLVSGVTRSKQQQPAQPIRAQQLKRIDIEVAVCFLNILYEVNPLSIETHLNYIKQVTSNLKKMFEKGFETSNKSNNTSRVYELPPLTEGSFSEMLSKDLEIKVELIKPENLLAAEQNYERDNIKSYATRRPLFVILLRILAAKFNAISHSQDQANILDIFLSIYQKIADPQLKIEVINILKCMFIGARAWEGEVPARYARIPVINYPTWKLFYLLFEDSSKFNEHFERRKNKPSDQNYNINERIYDEITTKVYFNFLCQFIVSLRPQQLDANFLAKIKMFVLFAVKVVDPPLLDQILTLLDQAYAQNHAQLYVNLFEDYRELNCLEESLQGDEISLFFTYYLYRKALQHARPSVTAFGRVLDDKFAGFYLNYLKSDVASPLHTQGLFETLRLVIKVLPQSRNLPKVLTEYLLNGNYNEAWGSIVLRVALDCKCLSPDQLYKIASSINEYGALLKELEGRDWGMDMPMLDYTYRVYGDKDLIYGYKMGRVTSPSLRLALLRLQQRNYVESLTALETHCESRSSQRSKRGYSGSSLNQSMLNLQDTMGDSLVTDVAKECFKSLNQWQQVLQTGSGIAAEVTSSMEYLFHSGNNRERISSVLTDIEKVGPKHFPFYYGKSMLNFLQSGTNQNKELNIALLYALLEWLSFPKNASHNQNRMLVKIQCLLELEEGEKIKEQSSANSNEQPSQVDALTKVVQSVYTQINSWRQRMPEKYEDLWSWHAILGQRIMVYQFMKGKMVGLLDNVVKNQSMYGANVLTNTHTEKLLIPYTDIEWNKLRLIRQERYFGVFNPPHQYRTNPNHLYFDEHLLSHKEQFYFYHLHGKDPAKAIEVVESLQKDHKEHSSKDEELNRMQKLEVARLKGKALTANQSFTHANALFSEVVRGTEQHLLPLWRDWLLTTLKAYETNKDVGWAQQALVILPYAIRYKTHKTKLILGPVLGLLQQKQGVKQISQTLTRIMDIIPIKPFLIWLPQVLMLAHNQVRQGVEGEDRANHHMYKILEKLSIYYPQSMYFVIKQLFRQQQDYHPCVKEVFLNIKKIFYNLVTKLEIFSQLVVEASKKEKVSVHILGSLTRIVTELHMPLYENWRGELEPQNIPTIAQISEELTNETVNGVESKVMLLLGSDGKEYMFRLQKLEKAGSEMESLLVSQTLQMANNHLQFWREACVRKLKLLEERNIAVICNNEGVAMWRSNVHSLTPLDILNEFIAKDPSIPNQYPFSDRKLMSLPAKDRDATINSRMKEVVPADLLKQYISSKTRTHDDFFTLRKTLSYQYGAVLCLNYTLSIDTSLDRVMMRLSDGRITLIGVPYNKEPNKESPFAVRLSRGIMDFFGETYVNSGVLPAFIATADALTSPRLDFKSYLHLIYQDVTASKNPPKHNQGDAVYDRLRALSSDYEMCWQVMQVAGRIGRSRNVPAEQKYWV